MLVVADTTPIHYLVLTGRDHVLPRLYREIVVPKQVLSELLHEGTPHSVFQWASSPPDWLQVRSGNPDLYPLLDPGEAAALAIAVQIRADGLLADDLEARIMAQRLGFVTVGTIGILAAAHNAGLVNFDDSIRILRNTNFHLTDEIIGVVKQTIVDPEGADS
jgi:predicted nucleic acid-binding protein